MDSLEQIRRNVFGRGIMVVIGALIATDLYVMGFAYEDLLPIIVGALGLSVSMLKVS